MMVVELEATRLIGEAVAKERHDRIRLVESFILNGESVDLRRQTAHLALLGFGTELIGTGTP